MCCCKIQTVHLQKQLFADVFQNRSSEKCSQENTCWNLFSNKVAGLRSATLFKKDSNTCVFLESYNIFKNSFFYRIPLVAVFAPGVTRM